MNSKSNPPPLQEELWPIPAEPLGVIGLGLLGCALAARALASGLTLMGFDIDERRRAQLHAAGGDPLALARKVAQACRRILLVLPDDGVTRNVLCDLAPRPCHDLVGSGHDKELIR